jgi:hypothetical protein
MPMPSTIAGSVVGFWTDTTWQTPPIPSTSNQTRW